MLAIDVRLSPKRQVEVKEPPVVVVANCESVNPAIFRGSFAAGTGWASAGLSAQARLPPAAPAPTAAITEPRNLRRCMCFLPLCDSPRGRTGGESFPKGSSSAAAKSSRRAPTILGDNRPCRESRTHGPSPKAVAMCRTGAQAGGVRQREGCIDSPKGFPRSASTRLPHANAGKSRSVPARTSRADGVAPARRPEKEARSRACRRGPGPASGTLQPLRTEGPRSDWRDCIPGATDAVSGPASRDRHGSVTVLRRRRSLHTGSRCRTRSRGRPIGPPRSTPHRCPDGAANRLPVPPWG